VAEFKSDGLTNLAEETSRQSTIQAVSWLLLAALTRFMMRTGSKKA
jgi:hypothetical protein